MMCLGCKVSDVYVEALHLNKKGSKGYCTACCPCSKHEEDRKRTLARQFTKVISRIYSEGMGERPPERRENHTVMHLLPGEQVVSLYSLFKALEKKEARGYA